MHDEIPLGQLDCSILVHDTLKLVLSLELLAHLQVVIEHHVDTNPAQDDDTNRNDLSAFLQYNLLMVMIEDAASFSLACEKGKKFRVVLQTVVSPIWVRVRRLIFRSSFTLIEVCLR